MQPRLPNTVTDILHDQQGLVKEDLLSFRLAHLMLFDTLAAVALVPVKSFDPQKINHIVYYHNIQQKTTTDDHDLGSNLIRNGNLVPLTKLQQLDGSAKCNNFLQQTHWRFCAS